MGETRVSTCSISLLCVVLMANFFGTKCETYFVGDEEGWNTQVNYDSWSRKYAFTVEDVLVFKYVKGQHNAYEVTEATYRSCDTSNGVLAKYESGNDEIGLAQPRKYWFICEVPGHCLGGMRFSIEVVNGSQTPPLNGDDSSSTYNRLLGRWWLCLGFLLLLVLI